MADSLAFWKAHARVFDGFYSLPAEDVEELYVTRARAPSDDICLEILSAADGDSPKFLMCGGRGSGKSTELIRIASLLRDDFVSVRVDVAPLLRDGFTSISLILALAAAVEHALRWWNDPRPEIAFEHREASAAYATLTSALAGMGAVADHAEQLIKNVGALVTVAGAPAAAAATPLLALTSAAIRLAAGAASSLLGMLPKSESPSAQVSEAGQLSHALNALLGELLRVTHRRILLLVEGFDKARELREVEGAFDQVHLLEGIEAPIVFSGPVTILYTEKFGQGGYGDIQCRILYNVPILHPPPGEGSDASPNPAGRATMRHIFQHRARRERLPDGAVLPSALDLAVAKSNGLPREMFILLDKARREAIKHARTTITESDVEEAITSRRLHLQHFAAAREIMDILGVVLQERSRPTSRQGLELLYEGYIAAYPNGDTWFRPHEILVDWLRRTTS